MPQTRVVWPLPEVPRECDTTGEYTFNEQNDEKMKH